MEFVKDADLKAYADFDNREPVTGRMVERAALRSLPVIDLTPYTSDGSEADRARVAAEIRQACIDIGFFYLTGHGIPAAELDELIEWGHRFWALPLAERMKLHKSPGSAGMGYVPAGGTDGVDQAPDTREVYSITREALPGEPAESLAKVGRSAWPYASVLPGFREFVQAHVRKRMQVTMNLLRGFAGSLGLAEDYFEASHHYLSSNLVFNYYAPVDAGSAHATQWGISPHTDYGTFTLLWQDSLGGLEIRNAADEWITAPPLPGAFVVNIGDLFQRWTNDLYISTLHRALAQDRSKGARISVPFFVIPQPSVQVVCLETCREPGQPPRYEPVGAGEYVQALVDQSRRTGRAGISTLTANRLRAQ